ncbi:MAG: rhodanese-like domain-containing protein [Bacteroidales bacterium]|jgi:rhodanese-related sulfurtransferase|nr:rhodanese-like domain-containing protein [Bacteroidales bacterium]
MNYKSVSFILFASLLSISVMSCRSSGNENKAATAVVQTPALVIGQETSLLLKDLEENGDYVNSQYFPSLIKSSVVFEELEKNNLIIDLRTPETFKKGHIRGAVSKNFGELPEYFETGIRPFEYDRIIMVCDDGQVSSYTTSLLRMMGYGNVFALRWGMGGWNRSYAQEGWMKGVSGKHEEHLETVTTEAPGPVGMPELLTGLATGKEISDARFRNLFEEGTEEISITADEVFNDPGKYFVINLERKDKYDDGHIPGAVRYKPESTLGFPEVMATIPSDKTVVVYCGTGHNSAFATAFLRLFGYDARTLRYGNNSFMYDKMIKERTALSWLPFTLAESNDYPVVK